MRDADGFLFIYSKQIGIFIYIYYMLLIFGGSSDFSNLSEDRMSKIRKRAESNQSACVPGKCPNPPGTGDGFPWETVSLDIASLGIRYGLISVMDRSGEIRGVTPLALVAEVADKWHF
ncbi:unnamed protein product [Larinioides sclopetarius]|uniref:Uncharacterized protein n=1 Tax=Larinioides sclopetarius TaxID=280406 RepID=A0AAV1ZYI2_9ARAC